MKLPISYKISVVKIDLTDPYEGIVSFKINNNDYIAFFWGESFTEGEYAEVEFSHLDYPLDWEVIFNENQNKEVRLAKTSQNASYVGYGLIKSINPLIANFGDVCLDLGSWTNDEKVIGEYIYWKIDRLDLKRRTANNKT